MQRLSQALVETKCEREPWGNGHPVLFEFEAFGYTVLHRSYMVYRSFEDNLTPAEHWTSPGS